MLKQMYRTFIRTFGSQSKRKKLEETTLREQILLDNFQIERMREFRKILDKELERRE